jgi:hypothetical protein
MFHRHGVHIHIKTGDRHCAVADVLVHRGNDLTRAEALAEEIVALLNANTISEIRKAVEAWHEGKGKIGITIVRSILNRAEKGELERG